MMILNQVSIDSEIIINVQCQLQTRLQMDTMILLYGVGYALHLLNLYCAKQVNTEQRRAELMSFLVHMEHFRNFIEMGPQTFIQLCNKLRRTRVVKDNM